MISEKEALLYSKMPQFKYLVKRTEAFIEQSLAKVENPYVACSFGKDSSVMLDLILKQKPDTKIVFAISTETFIIDNYEEIIKQWHLKYSYDTFNLTMLFCEREEDGRTHTSEKMSSNTIHDSYFVGIRADESKDRAQSLKFQGKFYKKKDGKIRICPLSEWKSKDIMTYILANKIPLLDTYKEYGEEARTTSVIPTKGKERMLNQLKRRDINAYNQLINSNLIK